MFDALLADDAVEGAVRERQALVHVRAYHFGPLPAKALGEQVGRCYLEAGLGELVAQRTATRWYVEHAPPAQGGTDVVEEDLVNAIGQVPRDGRC